MPGGRLRAALDGMRRVVKPGGLVYVGLYGGRAFEGVWDGDHLEPKRYFCHHGDEDLRAAVAGCFDLESFRTVPEGWNGLHFQSLVLRRARSG